ncbi:hypothetical protein KM043_000557 [Ampulex compressa]|nr:hypothetical protein KM043_000557 [Ampulex compressa]
MIKGRLEKTRQCLMNRLEWIYRKAYTEGSYNAVLTGFWGLIMHLCLLWGVLDVNFHSPIVRGLPIVQPPSNAPAKRLLLFVADGLRYRTFIETPPPYLGGLMENESSWGVSHTRMPTESRPGNVAIAAGLYEDPSALFKGWKENPVDFDSVFNQSRFTWAWGSPDIIPMFTKDPKGNVHGDSYPAEWQNFDTSSGQVLRLDSWVFDKYFNWLETEADKMKSMDGIIIYFHLLGCDTTGHSAKPHSKAYIENMNYVDRKIQEVVQKTETFFENGSTAYIFTADHGMTNWGSHGSGSTDETETPLIVWGAGINNVKHRQDVEQADIAPLISSLIGIPIPVNSEGILPWQYLNTTNNIYIGRVLQNNIRQLSHQITANRIMTCGDNAQSFSSRENELNEKVDKIERHFKMENTVQGLQESIDVLTFAKEALSYFRQYQRSRLLFYLSTMWLGWIIFLFFKVAGTCREGIDLRQLILTSAGFGSVLIIIILRYKVSECENWRLLYYASIAIISLWLAVQNAIICSAKLIPRGGKEALMESTGVIFLLAIMYAGLTYRYMLSIGMLCTTLLQSVLFQNASPSLFWTGLLLAIFPLLPAVEPYPRVYIVSNSHIKCAIGLLESDRDPTLYDDRTGIYGIYRWTKLGIVAHSGNWPHSDTPTIQRNEGPLSTKELSRAAIFMLYTLLCFFGTGNMASISSFDPSWTRHFITIFSPFVMTSLILLKLSIPLLLIGCTCHNLGHPTIFLAVLLLGDCLALPLMYSVTPHGSWLDIGSAISRFTIAISLPCLLVILHYIAQPFLKFSIETLAPRVVLKKEHFV